jgi:ABC-2 type transport system permease protein
MSTRRLLAAQLRASLALAMQYRADFFTDGFIEAFWTATALVPLFVVYGNRASIAGWAFGEALLVTAFFTLLQGILEGIVNPCVAQAVEQIRKGTFDFVLLKPHDAQLLVSTSRIMPWRSINVVTAIVFVVWGFVLLGRAPSVSSVALALVFLAASLIILYSLWMVSVTLAFWVIKVDNLTFLFGAIFDAARWPVSVFKGVLRLVFTFLIPLAMMTTFPAEALLGRAGLTKAIAACAAAVAIFAASRTLWRRAISKYTSASS